MEHKPLSREQQLDMDTILAHTDVIPISKWESKPYVKTDRDHLLQASRIRIYVVGQYRVTFEKTLTNSSVMKYLGKDRCY